MRLVMEYYLFKITVSTTIECFLLVTSLKFTQISSSSECDSSHYTASAHSKQVTQIPTTPYVRQASHHETAEKFSIPKMSPNRLPSVFGSSLLWHLMLSSRARLSEAR